jgi:general secretion pathway protein J
MRNHDGFTLLEILIALFIFTIVSIIMMTALHTVLTSQSATEKKSIRLTELETALILMSRDLEQTVNRPVITSKDSSDLFIGTEDSVTFTHAGLANPMGALQRSTLQRTEYRLNKNRLIRLTWPVLDQTSKTQPDQRILLTNVNHLRFEYLDDKGHFQNKWIPSNNTDAFLPKAIRVTLSMDDLGNLTQLYLIPAENAPKTAPAPPSSNPSSSTSNGETKKP